MSKEQSLSPTEKGRLNRSLDIVSRLASKSVLSETNVFILHQRTRHILIVLGAGRPSRTLVSDGIEIIKDAWPFKIYRLRKLIDGRRSQQ